MKTEPNENIIELRRLSDYLYEKESEKYYKSVVNELKRIVNESKGKIDENKTLKAKIKCYESMCVTITDILKQIK